MQPLPTRPFWRLLTAPQGVYVIFCASVPGCVVESLIVLEMPVILCAVEML
jgi:hypothetical protein